MKLNNRKPRKLLPQFQEAYRPGFFFFGGYICTYQVDSLPPLHPNPWV